MAENVSMNDTSEIPASNQNPRPPTNNSEDGIDQLILCGVMTLGPIDTNPCLREWSNTNAVHRARPKVHRDSPWHITSDVAPLK